MLPDVAESPVYWAEFDPRAEATHRGIISHMVVDFQPLSLVQNKGFLRQALDHARAKDSHPLVVPGQDSDGEWALHRVAITVAFYLTISLPCIL